MLSFSNVEKSNFEVPEPPRDDNGRDGFTCLLTPDFSTVGGWEDEEDVAAFEMVRGHC
jgi:hypothetical protein